MHPLTIEQRLQNLESEANVNKATTAVIKVMLEVLLCTHPDAAKLKSVFSQFLEDEKKHLKKQLTERGRTDMYIKQQIRLLEMKARPFLE